MFYIVENLTQFQAFKEQSIKEHFIYPIYEDNRMFPTLSQVCAVYVYSYYLNKSFIINIRHPDCTEFVERHTLEWVKSQSVIYTSNGRRLLHWAGSHLASKTFDLQYCFPEMEVIKDPQFDWYYNMYPESTHINNAIPISIHKRIYDQWIERIETAPYIEDLKESIYDSFKDSLYVFTEIEKNGINVDIKTFKTTYKDVNFNLNSKVDTIYSWYNLYNKTSRITNSFNSVNFAALPHDNGIRNAIKASEGGILIEFDFVAYHMYLLADLTGYVPTENINMYLAKQYFNTDTPTPKQYEESKGISYKAIYTESKEYNHIEFIKLSKDYKEKIFSTYSGTVTKGQILSHRLQELETIRNVSILKDVINLIQGSNVKIVMYTYDAFLFDIPKTDKKYIKLLKDIIHSEKYPVRTKYGKNYGELKELK